MPNQPGKPWRLPTVRPIVVIVVAVILLLGLALPAFWSALQREIRQQRSMKALSAQLQGIEKTLLQAGCSTTQVGRQFVELARLAGEIHVAFPELRASAPSFATQQGRLLSQAEAAAEFAPRAANCSALLPSYESTEQACESCHRALRGN